MNQRLLLMGLVLALNSSFAAAQSPENFFPSQVGNLWQYNGTPPYFQLRFTRDSTDSDQSLYLFGTTDQDPEYLVFKIDTSFNVYDLPTLQWHRIYTLDADSGNAWVWYNNGYMNFYGWVYQITTYPVFGIPTAVNIYRLGPFHPDSGGNEYYFHERHLASGFGLVFGQGEPGYMYWLRGCVINGDTFGNVVSVPASPVELPTTTRLHQNYPNPFNPYTTIRYGLASTTYVGLKVFNVLGQEVAVVVDEAQKAGSYEVTFQGDHLASGVYLYTLIAGEKSLTRKMILAK